MPDSISPKRVPPQSHAVTPGWLPQFNKRTHNKLQRIWAPYLPPWAMIVHVGRKSGQRYETPVTALRSGSQRSGYTISIILLYGSRTDWMRNLFAAGSCELRRGGHVYQVTNPRVVTDPADPALHGLARQSAKRVGVLVADIAEV
ncbi:nitroreductase family deazaflavin-dependent oxidoreductase [Tomitella biformata]|uniref:nitroreductase family deazaflavin-dependent oxidoreductase n=1 Tax=Tomitella biformata TaxID=630403 RepID=UPI00046382C6|nr:nitroreductase family deazaflavin-dependent oxidoreductase [Tomitella biformata]